MSAGARDQVDEWFIDLYEDEFKKLDGLARDLKHEIGNPLQVVSGHLELNDRASSPLVKGETEEAIELVREFAQATDHLSNHVELYRTVPEPMLEELEEYASDERFPQGVQPHADRISTITRDVLNYQNMLVNGQMEERASASELMRPLERCAENIPAETDFCYNGMGEENLEADTGMRMAFWTLGKNWESHASKVNDEYEVGFGIERKDGHYEIDIWNTGKGFFEEGLEKTDRTQAAARKLHRNGGDGHGLEMASDIFEVYGGEIAYSEERIGEYESGLGVKIRVPDPQYSTSDPS